jgi:hypothetical protein
LARVTTRSAGGPPFISKSMKWVNRKDFHSPKKCFFERINDVLVHFSNLTVQNEAHSRWKLVGMCCRYF